MNRDLTQGPVMGSMLRFAVPMILGDLLQQCYNIADTLIVGRYLGKNALAAVGSSFTLMTFLTSILLGLCMGSGAVFSIRFGQRDRDGLREGAHAAFVLIAALTAVLNAAAFLCLDWIEVFLQVPEAVWPMMREYLSVIFCGIAATFLYNYFASFLRAVGNSVVPLLFLGVSALANIVLDLLFIRGFHWGVGGAAIATVISQYLAGIGIVLYYLGKYPQLRVSGQNRCFDLQILKELAGLSSLTCLQQSIMNFGILMVQGLVNSFGPVVMAAFAAAVKIDSFAYAPVQDFGNAFSTYVAQNYGAGKKERISRGMKDAVLSAFVFCFLISTLVVGFAKPLMGLFLKEESAEAIAIGAGYLHIEAAFYFGIGLLFLFYGYYRAVHKPGISVVLTVISLGTRVVLAYALSSIEAVGVTGIWMSVPIGWVLADLAGAWYYFRRRE